MSRMFGTVSMGIRAPIIRQGDDLSKIVVDCVREAMKEGLAPRDRDVVAMTEAIVARSRATMSALTTLPRIFTTSWVEKP